MNGFGPSLVQPSPASQDPTKHVNYALGMVLGVDDLNQEFAYHNERDQWTVRDLLGYGTVWGLGVSVRDNAPPRGPEVVVTSGVGVNPRGRLLRVAPAQCVSLNEWMSSRTADILKRRIATGLPTVFSLPLYVVLSYRECLTDLVPIAGEPCRSESDSTAPSRATDDFVLELTFDPPPQQEEDALRQFVRWLWAHITVVGSGAASLTSEQFVAAIRAAAAAAASFTSSPPSASPPSGAGTILVEASPPATLAVPATQLAEYLQAALRLWVTELRPLWRPNWLGDKQGCTGDVSIPSDQGNQLLLAGLTLMIVPPGLNEPGFTVTAASDVIVSEDNRPWLLHLRFLQEWLLQRSAAPVGPAVVAAGVINADGSAGGRAVVNGLRVQSTNAAATATELKIAFGGYGPPPDLGGPQYLVKALPWPSVAIANLSVTFGAFQPDGLLLLVSKGGAALAAPELAGLQLMIEVSQYA